MAMPLLKYGTHVFLISIGVFSWWQSGAEGKEQAPILKANEFIMIRTTGAKQKVNIQWINDVREELKGKTPVRVTADLTLWLKVLFLCLHHLQFGLHIETAPYFKTISC